MSLTAYKVFNVMQFGKHVKSFGRNCCLYHLAPSEEAVRYSEHSSHCCTFGFKQLFKLSISSVPSQCTHDEIRQAVDYNATLRRVRASIFAVEKQ